MNPPRLFLALLLCTAAAPPPPRPVVLELFTSQGCSSCPPADALLATLANTRDDVLALDFHVDYWNGARWHDRFSLPSATQRQRRYATALGTGVYTPQLVVDGQYQAVGSARDTVLAAIASAKSDLAAGPTLHVAADTNSLTIDIGAGQGDGAILLVGYDPQHVTEIGGGENAGRVLREVNVVRSLTDVGSWQGEAMNLKLATPEGDKYAVMVQAADGRILAVGSF